MWGSSPLSSPGGGSWSAGWVWPLLSSGLAWSFGVKLSMGASLILAATHGAPLVVAHRFQKPGWLWELEKSGKAEVWVCASLHLLAVRKLHQIVGSSWASLKANAGPWEPIPGAALRL